MKVIVVVNEAGIRSLAPVPDGWEGETVDVDDATGAYLQRVWTGPTLAEQKADLDRIGKDGKPGGPAGMIACERCNAWFVPHLHAEHVQRVHGGT